MAQKVHIILVDDIDGSDASETIAFGLDGTNYEIDLNESNARALREALSPYVGHARKVTGARRGRRTPSTSSGNAGAVRAWARANGHEVSDRGRVPADIQRAYDAAH